MEKKSEIDNELKINLIARIANVNNPNTSLNFQALNFLLAIIKVIGTIACHQLPQYFGNNIPLLID